MEIKKNVKKIYIYIVLMLYNWFVLSHLANCLLCLSHANTDKPCLPF